jgi:hypothetical protein
MRIENPDWRNPLGPPVRTIIEYTNTKPPASEYPRRIVSPSQSSLCCTDHSTLVGEPETNCRFRYQYQRCVVCGFAVRRILHELPPTALIRRLQKSLRVSFSRKWQDPADAHAVIGALPMRS